MPIRTDVDLMHFITDQPKRGYYDRVVGALFGLLIGDAVGVPYEFLSKDRIPPSDQIGIDPPAGFPRSHSSVPPGTWSDDGAQALCLLASLQERNGLDPHDLMCKLHQWLRKGLYAVDGHVFDVGNTTLQAISNFANGTKAWNCGVVGEYANGNGSLMRVLPLVLFHRGDDRDLVESAMAQSRVTHGETKAKVCCAFYCLWARNILFDEHDDPVDCIQQAIASLREMFAHSDSLTAEMGSILQYMLDNRNRMAGSGYVVDCLWSAVAAFHDGELSYAKVVRGAIRFGNDTDTTACVAGGLAGLYNGFQDIPTEWFDRLRGKEMVLPLVSGLIDAGIPKRWEGGIPGL